MLRYSEENCVMSKMLRISNHNLTLKTSIHSGKSMHEAVCTASTCMRHRLGAHRMSHSMA